MLLFRDSLFVHNKVPHKHRHVRLACITFRTPSHTHRAPRGGRTDSSDGHTWDEQLFHLSGYLPPIFFIVWMDDNDACTI